MPTVWVEDDVYGFDRVVVKRNGYVLGIDTADDGAEIRSHYPPHKVTELEGEVTYER